MNPFLQNGPPGPQGAPQQAPAPPQLTPEQIQTAHSQGEMFLSSLMDLVSKPRGQLTKQDAFQSAADLIGKGLFSDPQAKMKLVGQLTQLPDDETALRQALGQEVLQASHMMSGFKVLAAQAAQQQGGGNAV